ncbi:uncharacterized protein C18orf63 homolog [Halichoeres trimaculatus]|uniref:uncharacterized protein C18orf63 homolog n=1 Tax=Halichoeres trimaculatus TaxID=147232 RepID=UPI003D9F6607
MSGAHQSMYFLGLPDLKKLCSITLTLQEEEGEELRTKQIKTCRELVLLHSDVLASPALDSLTEITAVMAISFFQTGILQVFGRTRSLQVGPPQCVFPGILQACLSYSLITRLAPSWNKAGLFLISGKDFLAEGGRLNAVSLELSTTEGQLCISIEANTVRLPPTTLQDFDLPLFVLRRFCSDPDAILDPTSTGGAIWCHVLPSMKKGQIVTISRQLPKDGPFRTYRDLQSHWNHLYGYRLPDLAEEEVVYCSVYFRPVGDRLFTYPLSCIRLQPVQRCPRVDLQGALGHFLSDMRIRLQSVCGFPAQLTRKPCYRAVGLSTAATAQDFQVSGGDQINLTSSCSVRKILTQLPPPLPRPVKPMFGSQPSPWMPVSQQDGVQRILGNGCRLTQSQGCHRDQDSSSSSFGVSFSIPDSFGRRSAPYIPSSYFSQSVFQPASSFTSSSSFTTLPPPPLPPLPPLPKFVPIFKNKCPSRHVNVAILRAQKQKEQLIGGGAEKKRVTFSVLPKETPTTLSSSSSSSLLPPPPTIPRFKPHPKLKRLPSLSPESRSELQRPEIWFNPISSNKTRKTAPPGGTVQEQESIQPQPALPEHPRPLTATGSSDSNTFQGVVFESKPKKPKSVKRVADVEKMARSNQLSKLSSLTLLAWLKERGVTVSAKHRKEELMLKVMACLKFSAVWT